MPVYASHLLSYEDLRMGQRIREERLRLDLTLQELARRSGVSTARLSQIENGLHVPDLRQAFALASAFGVCPESLFPADLAMPYQLARETDVRARAPLEPPILRIEDGSHESHQNKFWPLADLFVGRQIEPLLGRIMPASSEHPHFVYHHEYEFVSVLKGTIEFLIKTPEGVRREELHRGDSVYFRSTFPHCLRSTTPEPAETLHVLSSSRHAAEISWNWLSPGVTAYRATNGETDVAGSVGREIRLLRTARGWSSDELAAMLHLKPRQLERIEQGQRSVPLDVLMRLARALGEPVNEFVKEPRRSGPYYSIQRSADLHLVRRRQRRAPVERHDAEPSRAFYPLAADFPTCYMFPYFITMLHVEPEALMYHEHHGQEFVYVLNGQLELTTYAEQREVKETLMPGDAYFLDSSVPHRLRAETRNPFSKIAAEVLAVFWCPLGEGYLFSD